MADGVDITAGSGTKIGTDQVVDGTLGTVHVQYVKLMDGTLDGTGKIPGDATNGLDVDVTRVQGTVTVDSELPSAAALADAAANPTAPMVGANLQGYNGSTWDRLRSDTTNGLDVDVTRIIPGTSATSLGKAEDAAHTDGDVGVMVLAKRTDSAAVSSGTDGDYSTINVDATGRLWVRPAPVTTRIQVTPTISSSPAYTSGDVVGGLQTISNAARVSGGSGTISQITVMDKTQAQRAAMDILFFDRSVTVAADNAAVAMSDSDMAFCLGVISIGPYNTAWPGTPLNSISTLMNVGFRFVLNGTDLFAVAVVRATPTYTSTSDLIFSYTIDQD